MIRVGSWLVHSGKKTTSYRRKRMKRKFQTRRSMDSTRLCTCGTPRDPGWKEDRFPHTHKDPSEKPPSETEEIGVSKDRWRRGRLAGNPCARPFARNPDRIRFSIREGGRHRKGEVEITARGGRNTFDGIQVSVDRIPVSQQPSASTGTYTPLSDCQQSPGCLTLSLKGLSIHTRTRIACCARNLRRFDFERNKG